MQGQIKSLLKKTNNINRSAYIWNLINACMSAAESPIILMVLARTNGLEDVGVFSIAFAVASLMLYIGQYGFRRYQSSDVTEKYSFEEYYGSRILSCIAMLVATIIYCIYGVIFRGYSASKFIVVLLICLLKGIQAFSDVLHGRMQQLGRLDVATKSSCIRYILEMLSFVLVLMVSHNLLLASGVCVIVSFTIFMLTSYNVAEDFCTLRPSFKMERMKLMFIEGFPLFVSLFLNMYICNAPKYAIDAYLDETTQALYNMVFMPAFVIQLVAHFIFNPIIKTYAEVWQTDKGEKFKKLVDRQCLVILGLTALAVICALTIGIPVLSWIFGTNLESYKTELLIVVLGGGMLAYSVFFNTIITIIRQHKTLIYSYVATAIAAIVLAKYFITNYEIMGAVVLYGILMTILAGILAIITYINIRNRKVVK